MILKPAGTNRDGILIFCFGELLFVFVFYSRNDYRLRISVVNMLMLPRRTCNDMQTFGLDFISHPEGFNGEIDSHPEGFNGEIDLGCWMLEEEED